MAGGAGRSSSSGPLPPGHLERAAHSDGVFAAPPQTKPSFYVPASPGGRRIFDSNSARGSGDRLPGTRAGPGADLPGEDDTVQSLGRTPGGVVGLSCFAFTT